MIVGVNGSAVNDAEPLYAALDDAAGGELALRVVRGTEEMTVATRLGDRR